jgi:hypothetical protein
LGNKYIDVVEVYLVFTPVEIDLNLVMTIPSQVLMVFKKINKWWI